MYSKEQLDAVVKYATGNGCLGVRCITKARTPICPLCYTDICQVPTLNANAWWRCPQAKKDCIAFIKKNPELFAPEDVLDILL